MVDGALRNGDGNGNSKMRKIKILISFKVTIKLATIN